jgi:His-Xaa-Ser system radical SAM maturase HxsC
MTMIPLSFRGRAVNLHDTIIGRVTSAPCDENRSDHVLRVSGWPVGLNLTGYAAVLCRDAIPTDRTPVPVVSELDTQHISDEDVVAMEPSGRVRSLYRRHSSHNSLFATEKCNSLCLMCSQPPRDVDEKKRVSELLRIVRLISPETQELGITGGEPTLLKNGLIEVVRACRDHLPTTALHILSNGRLFYYGSFARALAEVLHPDVMVGVPLYSDQPEGHDHVVQVRGAFDETIVGLQNLGRCGVPVKIRVVVHALTYTRLRELAEFIYRNLTFATHVALMGLEQIGFAVANLHQLWVDPVDYASEMTSAVRFLADRGMNVSVYNHQLCTVPDTIWPYCRKSISDWKNEYLPVCEGCAARTQCGGFFSSVIRRRVSRGIAPLDVREVPVT